MLARDSRGRIEAEPVHPYRTAFQRDRDRVLHARAFRRLQYKTQVFPYHEGDHFRNRLTHTLEVAQIARTVARALGANEDLVEAIVLAHDIGHPPFGHAGERVLDRLVPGGFSHYAQSLRVIDVLENGRQGLNLTHEVRDGIARHSKGKHGLPVGAPPEDRASTLEGQIARVADIVAYVNHDIDDAVRAGILEVGALPPGPVRLVGRTSSERINTMVTDIMLHTLEGGLTEVRMSEPVLGAMLELREFLFEAVYENPRATAEFEKAAGVLGGLWEKLRARPEPHLDPVTIESEGLDAAARDFLAGMTDRYAVALFEEVYVPRSWSI